LGIATERLIHFPPEITGEVGEIAIRRGGGHGWISQVQTLVVAEKQLTRREVSHRTPQPISF
jgi:hypothetical protein